MAYWVLVKRKELFTTIHIITNSGLGLMGDGLWVLNKGQNFNSYYNFGLRIF